MTKKLTDNQIVGEAMYRAWRQQKAREREYNAVVAAHETEIRNDPEQIAWEREQGIGRKRVIRDEYEFVIPDGVKAVFYIVLFIAVVIGLIYTGG